MSKLEDMKNSFERKLDATRNKQSSRLEADLQTLRSVLLREFSTSLPSDLRRQAGVVAAGFASKPAPSSAQPLLDMTSSSQLRQIDDIFTETFRLNDNYPINRLRYPTIYCETLDEFFSPLVEQLDLSPEGCQAELNRLMTDAKEQADKHGGGMLGYNLPGIGAYINGWLIAYHQDFSPHEAFSRPEALHRILGTATHEKLGHGFLSVYSALGRVKNHLGLTQMDLARKFGLRTADDPTASLRREQANLLFLSSQLLEEGWATWVETLLAFSIFGSGSHPRSDLQKVIEAINELPSNLPQCEEIQQSMLGAILLLFGEEDTSLETLHKAVIVLEMIGIQLDELLAPKLGQPLRYLIGELLLYQAEINLGALCVPYAALIAAGVTFDPAQVGLSDLRDLLNRDPRLNPDARMAAISRLHLERKDDIHGMATRIAAQFSFSIPKELQGRDNPA